MAKPRLVLSHEEATLIHDLACSGVNANRISKAFIERGRRLAHSTVSCLEIYREGRSSYFANEAARLEAETQSRRAAFEQSVPDLPVFPKYTRTVAEGTSLWSQSFAPNYVHVSLRATSMDAPA